MKNKIFALLGVVLFSFASCTKDFEEINTNPNSPEIAPLTNVLGYTIQGLASRFGETEVEFPAAFAGYAAKGTYNDVNRYNETPSSGHWSYMFTNMLTNLNFIIENAEKEENFNIQAAAMVLKAYTLQMLVDAYGPIPYSDGGKAQTGNVYPTYDTEEEVYTALLAMLKEANGLFDENGKALGVGDIMYNGSVSSWKKLCNSLRLRVAIRMSNVSESTAKTHIAEIFNDASTYPVLASNADNASLKFPGGDWIEPWTSVQNSVPDIKVGKPIVDALIALNDPRLQIYAQANGAGNYIGLAVGADADGTNQSQVGGSFMFNPTGSVFFLKYSEVLFIKAEAAKRGFITATVEDVYKAAITASLAEYGLDATAYLAQTTVAWNNDLNRIYHQKWIALFRQSWEAWAEMRRTDVPQLPLAVEAAYTNHNRIPFRLPYPIEEKNLNGKNIPSNVAEEDIFWGYKIWWDTRSGVN